MKTIEFIRAAGPLLYGPEWKTELTHALGYRNVSSMQQWLSGARPIPENICGDIKTIIDNRIAALTELRDVHISR